MALPPIEALAGQSALLVSDHSMAAVFLGVLAAGEVGILAAFLLVADGSLPMIPTFAVIAAAVLLADIFWFLVGRLSRRYAALQRHYDKRISARLKRAFERLLDRHLLISLILVKYVYGLRLMSLLWLGFRRDEKFAVFLAYDLLSVIFYNASLAFIAIGASASIGLFFSAFRIVGAFSLAAIILLVLYEGARAIIGHLSTE